MQPGIRAQANLRAAAARRPRRSVSGAAAIGWPRIVGSISPVRTCSRFVDRQAGLIVTRLGYQVALVALDLTSDAYWLTLGFVLESDFCLVSCACFDSCDLVPVGAPEAVASVFISTLPLN